MRHALTSISLALLPLCSLAATAQSAYSTLVSASGAGQIAKTEDSGRTWALLPGYVEGRVLYSIHATTDTICYAVGAGRTVVKTVDGGRTWARLAVPPGYDSFRRVHFYDDDIGVVADGYGGVLWTDDGGQTWQVQSIGAGQRPEFVHCVGPRTAFLGTGSNFGRVFKTTDAGATWTPDPDFGLAQYRFCRFVDGQVGYIHGAYSGNGTIDFRLYRTDDGGASWNDIGPRTGIRTTLFAIDFADRGFGLFTSGSFLDDSLYRTTNGGASWTRLTGVQYPRRLVKLDFFSSTEAIAYGLGGYYATADRGESWHTVPAPGGSSIFDITPIIPAPSSPEADEPAGNGTTVASQPVHLSWSDGFKVRRYEVQFATDPSFRPVRHEVHVKTPAAVIAADLLHRPGIYFWRVRAVSLGSAVGPWSPPQKLEIVKEPRFDWQWLLGG